MQFLSGASVLVLGLGESGVACAQFAHLHGAHVTVADTRDGALNVPPGLTLVQRLAGLRVVLGAFETSLLSGVSQLVVSPGLSPHRPDVAALLAAAKAQGVVVCSEIDWFMQALKALSASRTDAPYTPSVLAITGTNGKTTVTELCAHLCTEAGVNAIACGNISPAALTALMDAMARNAMPQVWVLELSSFQLHYTQHLTPTAAAVLNLTQDHLDWHADMAEYAADKARIFGENTLKILNRDDPATMAMLGAPLALKSAKSAKSAKPAPVRTLTFGLDAPSAVGDVGCVQESGLNWLVQAQVTPIERKRRKADLIETHTQRLMPADALRIRGGHNHANAMAALLLVQAAGVPIAQALHGLRSFRGGAHRCEPLHIIGDVEYINDSKGTNVGATIAALNGLGDARQRLVLIAGGVGKGQDFSPLAPAVAQHCKAVVLIGQSAHEIQAALAQCGVPVSLASDLNDAIAQASAACKAGDAVLLSPACASFDQFKSYADRGQQFAAAVRSLALDRGQS